MPAFTDPSQHLPHAAPSDGLGLVEHWLAGGEMLPAQVAPPSFWTPEKKLAAAVLRDALTVVRDACDKQAQRPEVREDVRWILCDDTSWPFAFVPLCDLFGIDPAWVRKMVRHWQRLPCGERQRYAPRFRHAA